ncbi:MAG: CoA transferase [Actinomycetota bacterium]|nr:CoA transferase [Actinomycetota bacterium]
MSGPLADVRVLDLTSVVMGPFATQILGDLGADVVTVEDVKGDTNRTMGVGPHPQLSGVALNLLRNKRNISLDLRHPDGREACLRLAERSDIVITNLRPGSLQRLGLDYQSVRARKPDIVYCQAQGWPTDSPQADNPAYDDVVQSAAGVAATFQLRDGEPAIAPTILADKLSGLTIAYGVLAALHHRDRTGEGQRLEVPMVEAARAFVLAEHASAAVQVPPQGPAGLPRVLLPGRHPQRTKDGWIHVLPYSDQNYRDLFAVIGRHAHDDERLSTRWSRLENARELYAEVAELMLTRTTAEWLEYCHERDIPAGPVRSLDELVAELPVAEHPVAGPYRVIPGGVRFDGTPATVHRHAPLIGEHGEEVLAELGYTAEEIARLRAEGVLRAVPADATDF